MMILRELQDLLGGIYDVSLAHDVYDFLVTDRGHLPARCGTTDETLLVEQGGGQAGDGYVGVSLFLDPALLDRLREANPLVALNQGNVADYWTALEGVSHFVYFAWNTGHDKTVSLRELEMQAEVDKYVASYWLLKRQYPERFPVELMRLLFERTRIDPQLAGEREGLYRQASHYAERFCRRLERSLREPHREGQREALAELRRFYRLTDARKVAHIDRAGR